MKCHTEHKYITSIQIKKKKKPALSASWKASTVCIALFWESNEVIFEYAQNSPWHILQTPSVLVLYSVDS